MKTIKVETEFGPLDIPILTYKEQGLDRKPIKDFDHFCSVCDAITTEVVSIAELLEKVPQMLN